MGLNDRDVIVIALLIAFLVHYIRLNLRVWRLEICGEEILGVEIDAYNDRCYNFLHRTF